MLANSTLATVAAELASLVSQQRSSTSEMLSLADAIRAEMEAEEDALSRHLDEMFDGWQFTMDCALEGQIGAWVLGK